MYTQEDVKPETHQEIPGKFPYTRGPCNGIIIFLLKVFYKINFCKYPTMYSNKPWTIRQVKYYLKCYHKLK